MIWDWRGSPTAAHDSLSPGIQPARRSGALFFLRLLPAAPPGFWAQAERHIAGGERIIAQQRAIIAENHYRPVLAFTQLSRHFICAAKQLIGLPENDAGLGYLASHVAQGSFEPG